MKRSGPLPRSRTRPRRRLARTFVCGFCGEPFVVSKDNGSLGSRRYCSQTCMGRAKRQRIQLTCSHCGATFERVEAWVKKNSGRVYCGRQCQAAGRVRPESERSRGKGWRRLAEMIRVRDERRCVRCGFPEDGRQHAVDHIIPWVLAKDDPAVANDPVNLATLCLICHGIKTTVVEPRLLRGDWLALHEFYGRNRAEAAMRKALR